MSVVLGVDPSLTVSGCALVTFGDADGEPEWVTWRGRCAKPEVESVATSYRRMRTMLTQILAQVPPRLTLSVIEGPSMGSRHSGLADERAGLRWMLVSQLLARGPIVLVTPTSRQALTGVGKIPRGTEDSARKAMVTAAVRSMLPGANVPDHNVADAVAMAAAGAHQVGLSMPYTDKQISAHGKVPWPVEGGRVLAGMEMG